MFLDFSSEISTRGQKLTLEGNFLVSPTFLGCVPPLHLTVLLNIEPLESEIWPWPKWFLLPFFQGSDKINSFIYSWLVWLNENLLFSFGFYYIKENILFGLVSFMVLRFFFHQGGRMKGRETNIDRCLFGCLKPFAKIMTTFFSSVQKYNKRVSDGFLMNICVVYYVWNSREKSHLTTLCNTSQTIISYTCDVCWTFRKAFLRSENPSNSPN